MCLKDIIRQFYKKSWAVNQFVKGVQKLRRNGFTKLFVFNPEHVCQQNSRNLFSCFTTQYYSDNIQLF